MKISELMQELQEIIHEEGDIEVTCTGTLEQDSEDSYGPFETTVENLVVGNHKTIGKRVRLYL